MTQLDRPRLAVRLRGRPDQVEAVNTAVMVVVVAAALGTAEAVARIPVAAGLDFHYRDALVADSLGQVMAGDPLVSE